MSLQSIGNTAWFDTSRARSVAEDLVTLKGVGKGLIPCSSGLLPWLPAFSGLARL